MHDLNELFEHPYFVDKFLLHFVAPVRIEDHIRTDTNVNMHAPPASSAPAAAHTSGSTEKSSKKHKKKKERKEEKKQRKKEKKAGNRDGPD